MVPNKPPRGKGFRPPPTEDFEIEADEPAPSAPAPEPVKRGPVPPPSVEMDRAPVAEPREEREPRIRPPKASPFAFVGDFLRWVFSPAKILLAVVAGGAVYVWSFAGVGEAWVSGPAECGQSAHGFEGTMPYKDLALPPAFASFRATGLVCDAQLYCWARGRPWQAFQPARDHLFPRSPWGDAYVLGSLLLFHDAAKGTIRARNSEAGLQTRLTLGLEECVFALRKEKLPLFRYYLASVVGTQLEGIIGDGSAPAEPETKTAAPKLAQPGKSAVAPPVPEKKDATWNQKGWDRFMNYINTGK